MTAKLRSDLAVITDQIAPGSRVLDIGCGDGALMAALVARGVEDVRGMEIDPALVETCVARGLSVVQGDANRDLVDYPDRSFDVAVLSQTLQTAARPDLMLDQLLRIGREAFVSFPNFAHWRTRFALMWGGRMPVTPSLPLSWYETENIHHVTVRDFRDLLAERQVQVKDAWFFANGRRIGALGANWRAEYAMFRISRA